MPNNERLAPAEWIWRTGDRNGWNEFVAFRREFDAAAGEAASVEITAVARYELYVNGVLAAKGPGRGWPEEWFYDRHDVTALLRPGRNCLAVLVHQLGVSTFQHINRPAGLLARVRLGAASRRRILGTDSSWRCTLHRGFSPEAQQVCCQMEFSEIVDARAFPPRWKEPGFKDARWQKAVVVSSPLPAGGRLRPLDIDPLVRQELYPSRLVEVSRVRRPGLAMTVESRPYLLGDNRTANQFGIAAIFAFCVVSDRDAAGWIHMPHDWTWAEARLNGRKLTPRPNYFEGPSVKVRLRKGRNYLAIKCAGYLHATNRSYVFDFPARLRVTGPGRHPAPVFVGPFVCMESTWLPAEMGRFEELARATDFEAVWKRAAKDEESLLAAAAGHPIRETASPFLCWQFPYGDVVYAAERVARDVSRDDMRFLQANDAVTEVRNTGGGDTEFLVDFGRITCGYLDFTVEAARDNSLDLYFFEEHDVQSARSQQTRIHSTLRYFCRDGWQTFLSFQPRGGRFLRLVVRGRSPVKLRGVRIIETNAAVSQRGQFHSGDYTVNRAWEISRTTARFCMLDTYVDCPTYEQTFWVGDSRNTSLINFYVYGDYELTARCLRMVAQSMRRSGIPESQVPSGWGNVLVAWAELWMSACREYYEHSGDERFLRDIQPELMRAAEGFRKHVNADGLLEIAAWNLLDWAGMDTPDSGVVTHQNALLVKALRDTAAVSGYLGRRADAAAAARMAEDLSAAIARRLWSRERGAFYDSIHADGEYSKTFSVQTQTVVYLADAAPSREAALRRMILNPPKEFVKIGSPFMSFFYMEALAKMGRPELILPYVRENWGPRMLDRGATACWEVFDRTRSYCHAWSAAPGYFMGAYILGVRPAEPGFRKVVIDPVPSGLTWARGCVPTPRGDVYVSWRLDGGGKMQLDTRVPKGVEVVRS